MRPQAITLVALLAAALQSRSTPAYADNALRPGRIPNKARELADKGRKHHDAGDYTAAIAAFKEAYVLAPSPVLLFNIAQAYRLAGNCDEAAWMYRRFLDTDPRGPQRTLAENHHASVEKCGSGGLRVTVEPPTLDAKATTPLEEPIRITRPAPGSRSNKYKRAAVYTATGGGVVLIGAALLAIDSRNASRAVEETYRRGGKWEDVQPLDERGQRSATIATVLGIGGGVAMLSAAVLYGLGKHYEGTSHIAVSPTKDGARVSLSWGF